MNQINKVCWNITSACNKNCIYCFREISEHALSLEQNLIVLNNLKKIGVKAITFSGGEPLMYPYTKDLMRKAKELGIQVRLVTNASLLNEDNIKDILKDVDILKISLDSPSSYINEKMGRDKDCYIHIESILPIIRKYYPNIRIEINTVVTRDDMNTYRELFNMKQTLDFKLFEYNIAKWKILRFYGLRGKAKKNENKLFVDDEDFNQIKEVYSSNDSKYETEVRDIDSFDKDYIVSPGGYLKKSLNGSEKIIVDLKHNNKVNNIFKITKSRKKYSINKRLVKKPGDQSV